MKSPSDYDALDDIDRDVLGVDDEPDDQHTAASLAEAMFMCEDELDDGSVCGESFDTKLKLGAHRARAHGYRNPNRRGGGDKAPRKATRKTTKRTTKKPPEQKAAEAAQVVGDRAAIYTSSLAFIGLIAHVAVPPFDDYDLSVWNAGSPGLAAALDEVGAVNPTFRTGCDLVLGGGAGGAYVKLVLAAAAMATPIAAHHGFLPSAVGERMGAQIGVAPAPPTPTGPEPEPTATPQSYDPTNPGDVLMFLSQVPPRVGADIEQMMMKGAGPTVVRAPDTPSPHAQPGPAEETNGAGGSERLNPEAVTAVP